MAFITQYPIEPSNGLTIQEIARKLKISVPEAKELVTRDKWVKETETTYLKPVKIGT